MKQDAYERTLKARAFDISRYLLPLATNTSLGEIVNARTLETQVSHLLSHTHREVRGIGEQLKHAATSAAYNVNHESLRKLIDEIRGVSPELGARAEAELLKEVRVAPTLVKYADPNSYEIQTRLELRQIASELLPGSPEPAPPVDLLDDEPLEVEVACTLLYEHSSLPYRQIRRAIQDLPEARRREIIEAGLRHRGGHDEMLRGFRAGQQFRFDILMDIGGFRDMHRHRRCIQIEQDFTTEHGYEIPAELAPAGALRHTGHRWTRLRPRCTSLQALHARGRENSDDRARFPQTYCSDGFCRSCLYLELRTGPAMFSLSPMAPMYEEG
jgi:hypothetical protein